MAILINLLKKDKWEVNEKLLREEVLAIGHAVETIHLPDVTPFEWDAVYDFTPYTRKTEIYETVSYKWENISETVNEAMNQIVFLKDGKVVCYLYGYSENNRYGIFFETKNMLDIKDDLNFLVERSDSVIYLKN